jgi:hypothetical protein
MTCVQAQTEHYCITKAKAQTLEMCRGRHAFIWRPIRNSWLYMWGKSCPLFRVAPSSILYLRCRVWSYQFSLWRPGEGRKDGGKTVKATVHAFVWLEFDFGAARLRLTVTWALFTLQKKF